LKNLRIIPKLDIKNLSLVSGSAVMRVADQY